MSNFKITTATTPTHPIVLPPTGKQQPQGLKYIKRKRLPAIIVK